MKTAKIFQNGQSQAVRLPKEFRLMTVKYSLKKWQCCTVNSSKRFMELLISSLEKFPAIS